MDAITAMEAELHKIQQGEADCITESGIIKNHCRYRYQILVMEAKSLRDSIEWMKKCTNQA